MKVYELKESKIAGKGIFAVKDFNRGDHILSIGDETIEVKDPNTLGHELLKHAFPVGKNGNKFIYVISSPAIHLNHSCVPNAGIKNNYDLFAMKKIEKGDEILIDYAICSIDGFRMECKCGSKKCRKQIVSFEELDDKTQKRYLFYTIDYIREEYLRNSGYFDKKKSL